MRFVMSAFRSFGYMLVFYEGTDIDGRCKENMRWADTSAR